MDRCEVCRAVVRDDLALCRSCATTIGGNLREIPQLIEAARADLALQQRRSDRGPIGKTTEYGLPLARPAVINAVRDVDVTLGHVVSQVANVAGVPVDFHEVVRTRTLPPTRPDAPPVVVHDTHIDDAYALRGQRDPATRAVQLTAAEALSAWLINHLNAVRKLPAPAGVHDAIAAAVDTLRSAVDLPRVRKFRGPCRSCNRDLYAYDGDNEVTCDVRRGGCGAIYDATDLAEFLIEQARPVLMTADKARTAIRDWTEVDIPAGTIRTWHNRGQLAAIAWEHKGKPTPVWIHRNDPPLFRFGDILDLIQKPKRARSRTRRR